MEQTDSDKLYFGSVPIYLKHVSGQAFNAENARELFLEDDDAARLEMSLKRLKPLDFLGTEYANILVPAVTARDLCVMKPAEPVDSAKPFALQQPLLKVEKEDGQFKGIQSGRRSAIIKIEDKWYRLKGCGDLNAGFPTRNVEDERYAGCVELRGCMFEHLTHRELYYSHHLDSFLKPHGFGCANLPVAWFEYDLPGAVYSKVKRTCGVFETKGEKRLGDHGLVGLENLLPIILSSVDIDTLLALFSPERNQGELTETWLCTLTNVEDQLIDFSNFNLNSYIKLSQDIPLPEGIESEFLHAWKENLNILDTELQRLHKAGHANVNLFAYLFWRLGYEAGRVQRIIRNANVSWGTYVDPLAFHCNAHPNNLVILPEGSKTFLAPLDFDMAFSKPSFNKDEAQFDEWAALEDVSMQQALAGDQALNSGAKGVAILDAKCTVVKWALRDTLALGFDCGYKSRPETHGSDPQLERAAHALLRLALIVTSSCIA